jgi:hypothetical protein
MKSTKWFPWRAALAALLGVTLAAAPALAGPELICWPFDIGGAKSLPWGGGAWSAKQAGYNISRLSDDTLALLGADTPVIVRMETLRRAAVYAMDNPLAAKTLVSRLEVRLRESRTKNGVDALAAFDLGYLVECLRQAYRNEAVRALGLSRDGYKLVLMAIEARGADPQMEFAVAIIASAHGKRADASAHVARALEGAAEGSLLARNLVRQSPILRVESKSLAEMRTKVALARN